MSKHHMIQYYENSWDNYYESMEENASAIPWDVTPENACAKDWTIMQEHMDVNLPLMDIGCGIGTQSAFLSEYFIRVIGTDVSQKAVDIARQHFGKVDNLSFEKLNIIQPDQSRRFHSTHGDLNLYMRGTLQQILNDDRPGFSESISDLLGQHGKLYFIELSTEAKTFFVKLFQEKGGLPPMLRRVLTQKVTQLVGVHTDDLIHIFPPERFTILSSGRSSIALKTSAHETVDVPATYGVIQNCR